MTRRRIIVTAFGGPEQLMVEDTLESIHPGPGHVLVDVEAAGINYLDIYQRRGMGNVPLPYTPGLEGVGRVRELGEAEPTRPHPLRTGQRVAWIDVAGSYASQLLVPADRTVAIPDSFTIAQGLIFQALTAQYLATEYRDIRAGDRVLVHSAAGGVGQLLVQWLKHLGAWVIGTVSTDAKAETVRALGADAVITYGREYVFLDEVLSTTKGRGVDLAYDAIGAATLTTTLQCLARGGTVVSYGRASGAPPAIEPGQLRERCTRLAGGSVFSYVAEPLELQQRAAGVIEGIQNGWLQVDDGNAYGLIEAAAAHRALESRETQGKVFLTIEHS